MTDILKPYPAYKDSGVPWLGQVPAHWEVRAVRHVARPVKGRQPKALYSEDEAPAGAQPYLTMEYLRSHKGTAKVYCTLSDGLVTAAAGDVLLLWDGANAGEFFMAKDGVVSSTAALLSTDEHDRRYLYFMLKQCEPWLRALSTGMGIPHVDGRILKQMQICLPPHAEQAAIVRFLDWTDRRIRRYIRAKQKLIKLLEEYRQALIHRAVTGQIDVRTGQPYPAYKPSGVEWLGEVPMYWEVRRLKTLCRMKAGANITNQSIEPSGDFPVYGGNGVRGYTSNFTHEGEFILIGRQGALCGNVHLVQGRFWASEHAVVVSLYGGHDLQWFAALLEAMNLNQYSMAAAQPGLAVERVLNLWAPVPNAEEQRRIAEYITLTTSGIATAIAAARREIELLREYSTRLIADVVTGEGDVREVAAQLPEEPPEEEAELMDTDETAEDEGGDEEGGAEAVEEEEAEP